MHKFILLLFTLTLFISPGFGQKSESDREMNRPVEPFRIIGNIYYVGASDVTSYLITTPKGHILIDAGFEETVPQIKANVEKLGFKLSDIKILLLNHAHYDHCGGLAELKRLTGARLYSSPPDKPVLEDGGVSDFRFGGGEALFKPVKVDEVLRDRQPIELGGTVLTTYFTFGHTKGATSWTTEVVDGSRTYNVVFASSVTTLDYQFIRNPKYPEIAEDFGRTFKTLEMIKADVFLASHGQFFGLLEKAAKFRKNPRKNPFIDAKGYRRFVRSMSQSFEEKLKLERSKL